MIKVLLVVLAACTSPSDCAVDPMAGAIFEYPRLVDCVRAKEELAPQFEAFCLGKPFDPREQALG